MKAEKQWWEALPREHSAMGELATCLIVVLLFVLVPLFVVRALLLRDWRLRLVALGILASWTIGGLELAGVIHCYALGSISLVLTFMLCMAIIGQSIIKVGYPLHRETWERRARR